MHRRQFLTTAGMSTGAVYRFTPDAYPSLDAGLLEIATHQGR